MISSLSTVFPVHFQGNFPVALFATSSILVLAFILFVLICKVTEVAEYFVHLQLYSINNKSQKMDFLLYLFAEVYKY